MKVVKITIIILLSIVAITIISGAIYLKSDGDNILNFIVNNKEKCDIVLIYNDSVLITHNENKLRPLASTVKIIIAIEYANQVANGTIDPNEAILLSEIEKFYVSSTDGGAHKAWKKDFEKNFVDGKTNINDVAKGMIIHSSNANTEFLMSKLGFENINNRLDSLNIKNHTEIYPLVSALFVAKEAFPTLKGDELVKKLEKLDRKEYINYCYIIHEKLKTDLNYKNEITDLSLMVQKVFSDNLPASSTMEYAKLMKKINSKKYFNNEINLHLEELLEEFILDNPKNKELFKHCGMKGGSTAFLLTKALYATDLDGNKIELAYFLNDISILEMLKLQSSMNEFELNILTNNIFRDKVVKSINF